jgi:hypothetical protein
MVSRSDIITLPSYFSLHFPAVGKKKVAGMI